MDKVFVQAMMAELQEALLHAVTRAINLAGANAMLQQEVAKLQATMPPTKPVKEPKK